MNGQAVIAIKRTSEYVDIHQPVGSEVVVLGQLMTTDNLSLVDFGVRTPAGTFRCTLDHTIPALPEALCTTAPK